MSLDRRIEAIHLCVQAAPTTSAAWRGLARVSRAAGWYGGATYGAGKCCDGGAENEADVGGCVVAGMCASISVTGCGRMPEHQHEDFDTARAARVRAVWE
ncbi:hypothetical protein FGB62_60g113 [Gracilaria domingensis]|nr:hypothetical protein FGB62_60g113 [Gracilaria domingensis]